MVLLKKRFANNSLPTANPSRWRETVGLYGRGPTVLVDERLRQIALVVVLMLSTTAFVGCDLPSVKESQEAQWVISSTPKDGDRDVPRLGPISVELDRRILPHTVDSAPIQVKSSDVSAYFRPIIEPVGRLIRLELYPRYPLEPGVTYRLVMDGLIDLDGGWQDKPYEAFFRTAQDLGSYSPFPRATWSEVAPIFSASCSLANCHGSRDPALKLDLSGPAGVERTAVRVRSQQLPFDLISAEGARGALSLSGLKIIEAQPGAGRPVSSYLMYKVLEDSHILGDSMPPPESSVPRLSKSELKLLSYWIIAGAPTEE